MEKLYQKQINVMELASAALLYTYRVTRLQTVFANETD